MESTRLGRKEEGKGRKRERRKANITDQLTLSLGFPYFVCVLRLFSGGCEKSIL